MEAKLYDTNSEGQARKLYCYTFLVEHFFNRFERVEAS